MDDQEKIDLILAYAENHGGFDSTYVEELELKLAARGSLSRAQSNALDNIIRGYRMERWRDGGHEDNG